MAMGVIKAGRHGFTAAIDQFCARSGEIIDSLFRSKAKDFISFCSNKFRCRLIWVNRDDINILED